MGAACTVTSSTGLAQALAGPRLSDFEIKEEKLIILPQDEPWRVMSSREQGPPLGSQCFLVLLVLHIQGSNLDPWKLHLGTRGPEKNRKGTEPCLGTGLPPVP